MLVKVRAGPRFLPLHSYFAHQLQMFVLQSRNKNQYKQNPHEFYSNYITEVIHESARKVLHKQMTDAAF